MPGYVGPVGANQDDWAFAAAGRAISAAAAKSAFFILGSPSQLPRRRTRPRLKKFNRFSGVLILLDGTERTPASIGTRWRMSFGVWQRCHSRGAPRSCVKGVAP